MLRQSAGHEDDPAKQSGPAPHHGEADTRLAEAWIHTGDVADAVSAGVAADELAPQTCQVARRADASPEDAEPTPAPSEPLLFGANKLPKLGEGLGKSIRGFQRAVSGVDDKLENLKWKRFATGLYQPLGLRIVDDKVYTV